MDVREKTANEKRLIDDNDIYSLFDQSGIARLHVADIDTIPRVDAVEVVRCRDCKNWNFETGLCNLHSNFSKSVLHFFDESDFCSYGERKDGDGNG